MVTQDLDQVWRDLSPKLEHIIQGLHTDYPAYMEAYTLAYTMVVHNKGDTLYNGAKDLLTSYLEAEAGPAIAAGRSLLNEYVDASRDDFWQKLNDLWISYNAALDRTTRILKYMDRVYCSQAKMPTIADAGHDIFAANVIPQLKERLRTALAKEFEKVEGDRGQAATDVVKMLKQLKIADGKTVFRHEFPEFDLATGSIK